MCMYDKCVRDYDEKLQSKWVDKYYVSNIKSPDQVMGDRRIFSNFMHNIAQKDLNNQS